MKRLDGRPLTVRELIDQLSRIDPDLPVACRYDGSQETGAGPVTVENLDVIDGETLREASIPFAVIGEVGGYELGLWMREKTFGYPPDSPTGEA